MKKTVRTALCAAAAAIALTGCGGGDNTSAATAAETTAAAASETTAAEEETYSEEELTDDASITLGNYIGLSRTVEKADVTEDQIENMLQYLCTVSPAEISGRPAKEGDVVNIDYVGTKDGEAFDGGTASGYDLTLGSGQFIDGFEDGVIGMETGDEKDLNLTFPEDYGSEDLAGQDVVFHVTLNAIKDPENTKVDDALARRVLGDMTATVDKLRDQVKESLELQSESNFFNGAGTELALQALENSQVTADPQAIEQTFNDLKKTYQAYADQYGVDLETFLSSMMGTDLDGLRENAENVVRQEMVLNAIVEKEGLSATDEQKDALARINYYDSADAFIQAVGEEQANHLFDLAAAYYYLIDNSVLTEEPGPGAETEPGPGAETEAETTAAP